MGDIHTDLSAPKLVAAIEESLFQCIRQLFGQVRDYRRTEIHTDPEMMWSITDIPFPLFNAVLNARLAEPEVDSAIDAAVARCRERDVPLLWWTGPATRPADLGASLQAHGFIHIGDAPGMALDLDRLAGAEAAPAEITVQRVDDGEALRTWCDVVVAGFEMPDFVAEALYGFLASQGFGPGSPVHNYLALSQGRPVATASLVLGAGVAGIYNVSTLPEARRQGAGTGATLAALEEARRLGYRVAVLQSSPMGLGIYRRLGFEEYCTISQYLWQPAGAEAAH